MRRYMDDKNPNTRRSFLNRTLVASGAATVARSSAAAVEPQEAVERGSDKWMQDHGAMMLSSKDLGDLKALAGTHKAKMLSWCQYGQPGVDGVCGTFEVTRLDGLGPLVLDLAGFHPRFRLGIDLFPYGIP